MAVLNRRDYYAAIPQLEGRLSKLSKYITIEEGKVQIKVEDLYGKVGQLTVTAEGIEGRVEAIEDDYVDSTTLTQTAHDLTLAIDEKAQVFTSTPTPPYYVGDLWTQGPNGEIYRCKTNRLSGNYTASDWEKASDYTDDTTANAEVSNRTMLIRSFAGGTITAYQGNSYGVYTNASGSVDIVTLSWSGSTPSITDTLATYGSTTRIGSTSSSNIRLGSSAMDFYVGSSMRGRIGYSSSSDTFYINQWGYSDLEIGSSQTLTLYGSSGTAQIDMSSANTKFTNGSITLNSTVTSNNVTTYNLGMGSALKLGVYSSSRNKKTDISYDIEDEFDPHKLYDLKVATFRWKEEYQDKGAWDADKKQIGFIAEDVHDAYYVGAIHDTTGKTIDWSHRTIIPAMLALIQEQHKEIEELKRRIECLNESRK